MQTEAWKAAACWTAPGMRSKSESPVKVPGQIHGGKGESSTQVAKADDYARDFKQREGEKKVKGMAKEGRTCWVLFDFGANTNPPTHHIFNSWGDTKEEYGVAAFTNGVSGAKQRRFNSSKQSTCYQKAESFLRSKGIDDNHYGSSPIEPPQGRVGMTSEEEMTESHIDQLIADAAAAVYGTTWKEARNEKKKTDEDKGKVVMED